MSGLLDVKLEERTLAGRVVVVYGLYENVLPDTDEQFDGYDLWEIRDNKWHHLNEGDCLYEYPTENDILEYLQGTT